MRVCAVCGKKMSDGYVINDGEEYFCSYECLSDRYDDDDYNELFEAGLAYWTKWEEAE